VQQLALQINVAASAATTAEIRDCDSHGFMPTRRVLQ